MPAAEVRGDVPKQQPCLRAAHVGGGGSRKNTHVVFPLRRTQCLILPLFHRPLFHYSISGRVGRLKEEVKEVKSSHSEVLSEKKKLQEQLGILQKVGCDFFSFLFYGRKTLRALRHHKFLMVQEKSNQEIDLMFKLRTLQQSLELEELEHKATKAKLVDQNKIDHSIEEATSEALKGESAQCRENAFNWLFRLCYRPPPWVFVFLNSRGGTDAAGGAQPEDAGGGEAAAAEEGALHAGLRLQAGQAKAG